MTQPPTAPPAADQPGYWPPAASQSAPGYAPPTGYWPAASDAQVAAASTGYGAPAWASAPPSVPTEQPRTPAGTAWRVALVGVISLLGSGAGLVVALIAAITWSGCFLSCTGENHLGGVLLGLLSLGLMSAGPLLARGLFGRWAAFWWTVLAMVVVGPVSIGLVGAL